MNSDPQDSAAWRSFGILDADESSAFDDAARHDNGLRSSMREIDQLSAAIALAASHPVRPSPGHLERIRKRLALPHETRMPWWLGLSGWAAAAVLALLLVWQAMRPSPRGENHWADDGRGTSPAMPPRESHTPSPDGMESVANALPAEKKHAGAAALGQPLPSPIVSGETGKLTREIARLQDELEIYQEYGRAMFQAVPGMALPVIMKMSPPGEAREGDAALALNDSPVHQLFASRAETTDKQESPGLPGMANADATPPPTPSAIPIYDSARDAGTLVLSNLPPAPEGREYNLWARTNAGAAPVRIGILPDAGTSPSESFDFSLGTTQIIPAGFILTQDPVDSPASPHEGNTVLEGPQEEEP